MYPWTMRRSPRPRILVLIATVWILSGPVGSVEASGVPPGYVSEVLPNGLRVSILPDPAHPVVATQVWYHVGSANEDERSRGLAHMFEHLMFGETTTRSDDEYSDFHHRNGGDENAYTGEDETTYVSEIALEYHSGVLEREADRMANLVLTQEALDNEKKIVLEELRRATENDPTSRLMVEATRALFGSHPYALWPTGTKEDLERATLEECRRFYENHYRPNRAHLVIVGPVNATETLEKVRALFGPIPAGGVTPEDPPALDAWKFPEEIDLEEDLPPVEVATLGFPLPPADSPDGPALEVLAELLSGGSVDRFREDLVTRRRKAVEAGTEFLDYRRGGGVLFYAASLPYRRRATAFRRMQETLTDMSRLEWLTDETVASAKRALRRQQLSEVYYAENRAESIGYAAWWMGDDRRAFDRDERLGAVTPEQVRRVYRKYVVEPTPVRLYVRPEHVPLYVTLFGWLWPLVGR